MTEKVQDDTQEMASLEASLRRELGQHVLMSLPHDHYESLSTTSEQLEADSREILSSVTRELIDTYHSGRFTAESLAPIDAFLAEAARIEDPKERHREAVRLAEMLGADTDSAEFQTEGERLVIEKRRETFKDLVDRGASSLTARSVLGDERGLDLYTQNAQTEEQREMIAELASSKSLRLEMYSASGLSVAAESILEHPEWYSGVTRAVADEYDKAVASGYSAEQATIALEEMFGPYAINHLRQGEDAPSIGEQYEERVRSELRAMQLVGDDANRILALLHDGARPARDHIMGGVAEKIRKGEPIDIVSTKDILQRTAARMTQLKNEHPDVFEAFSHTTVGKKGDISLIFHDTDFAMRLAPDFAFLREVIGVETKQVLSRFDSYAWRDEETGAYRPELYRAIQDAKRYIAQYAELTPDRILYAYTVIGQTNESMDTLGRFFDDPDLSEYLRDPFLKESIDAALGEVGVHIENIDFKKDVDLLKTIGGEDTSLLSALIAADARTHGAGGLFHELAPDILTRKDRDGNIYDGPWTLSLQIQKFQDTNADHEAIRWFARSPLPISALDVVMQFRKKALKQGVVDEPLAIYEWIFSDEKHIEEMSTYNLAQYFKGWESIEMPNGERLQLNESALEGLIEAAREQADEMKNDFRLFVNASPQALQRIVEGGGTIRSTLESNGDKKSYTSAYTERRSGVEVALGIRVLDATSASQPHPVYGTAAYINDGIPEGAIGYGSIALVFKPDEELMRATSFTPEDSFHGAQRLNVRDAQVARIIKTAFGKGTIKTNEYVEAQISTELTLDQIERIYVSTQEDLNALPESLRGKAVMRAVSQPGQPSQYRGSREKRIFRRFMKVNNDTLSQDEEVL